MIRTSLLILFSTVKCYAQYAYHSSPVDSIFVHSITKSSDASKNAQMACALGLYCEVENENLRTQYQAFGKLDSALIPIIKSQADDVNTVSIAKLVKRANNVDAVFINEAHDNPLTRLSSIELIKYFRKIGYSTIFMEGLSCSDIDNSDIGSKGFYFRDPVMVYLYRTAVSLGYDVRCYDTAVANETIRDSLQAARIMSQLSPSEKFIVLNGYDHGSKSSQPYSQNSMANVLLRNAKIKTLHIDTYKFSFTGYPSERLLNARLSKKILNGKWWSIINGNEFGSIGMDTSAYDYHIIYADNSCYNIRKIILQRRTDIVVVPYKCKMANSILSVYGYTSTPAKNSLYLVDKIFSNKAGVIYMAFPKNCQYKVTEEYFKQN